MKVTTKKECYCHTCKKNFHWLGITRHRAMHRDKKEDCEITYTHGDRYLHPYGNVQGDIMDLLKLLVDCKYPIEHIDRGNHPEPELLKRLDDAIKYLETEAVGHDMTPKELAKWNIKQVKPSCKNLTKAEIIVEAIVYDINDRRGLKQEFRQIDDDIVEEIKEVWKETIVQLEGC